MIEPGKAIIIVGATGEGKTTLTKKLVRYSKVHVSRLEVYDVNAEWFPDLPLPDIDIHLHTIQHLKNRVMLFEDATGFFDSRSHNKIMTRLLVGKRHAKNCILLLFHSIRSIPYYIYNYSNYVIVLRTNDDDKLVEARLPFLYDAYRKVNYEPNKARQLRLPNGLSSPYEIVKLNVRKQ